MATFLVLAQDLPSANRVEGDPVSVKADNQTVTTPSGTWHWSAEEDIARWIAEGNDAARFPGLFYVINVPGLPPERAARILQPHRRPAIEGLENEAFAPDPEDRFVELDQHRWRFDIATKMRPNERAELRRRRKTNIPRRRLNAIMLDRRGRDVFDTRTPDDG